MFSKKFLDYNLYSETRFDMMIYKWDDKHIEGYFCVNFPLKKTCDNRTDGACNNQCVKNINDLFYKKMPHIITMELYNELVKWIKIKKENEKQQS